MSGKPTHVLHQNNGTMCPSYINYCMKRRCFVVQSVIQQHESKELDLKRTSAIKVTTMRITDHYEWKPSGVPQNQHFSL